MKQSYSSIKEPSKNGINKQFNKIRTKKNLTAWIMRQYFNPDLHSQARWYNDTVTAGNVLKFVSDPGNNFPLTPAEITDMFGCIQSFKKHLKKSEKELIGPDLELLFQESAIKNKPGLKYQTGEATLKEIGQTLGGLTPTMINKLGESGFDKIRSMTNNAPLYSLDEDSASELNRFITNCRTSTAIEYASHLLKFKGQIKLFVEDLVKRRIMTPHDLKIIKDLEIESLVHLASEPQGRIIQILLLDIERDNNIFKSYQSAVSKLAFPERRRGRPKKDI